MKISILTATRNRADLLGLALDSLDAQSFANWEHLVQDGGSDPATAALLETRNDPRRCVVRASDGGVYDALNLAMARASGDVVGVLHSDDVYSSPDVLNQIANAFSNPLIDAVYGDLEYFLSYSSTKAHRNWRAGRFAPGKLRRGWMPPHPALFVRRSVMTDVGPYDCNFRVSADYDLMLRLFGRAGMRIHYLPKVLVRMRSGGLSNGSIGKLILRTREDLQVLQKNGMGGHGTLAMKSLRKLPQFVT